MYTIVPAAGAGSRMGELSKGRSKVLLELPDGTPVLLRAIQSLLAAKVLKGLVIAVRPGDERAVQTLISPVCQGLELYGVRGGETRQDSVRAGLEALRGKAEFVVVHDAARPFCRPELIRQVCDSARQTGASILAVPIKPSIKVVSDFYKVQRTIPRANLWEAQTPQVFHYTFLDDAHKKARDEKYIGTDDSELVERYTRPVTVVMGDEMNIKITSAFDLEIARLMM